MKPQQILDLEKYWGIEIEDNRFEVDESGIISFSLSANRISDISPLKDLTQLTSLSLSVNQISDISPLKDLTQLTSLSLDNNEISDVSIIKDLINLVEIDIRRNRIEKIVLEKELPKLKKIQLWQNKIDNIDFVKQLPNLEYLDISFNNITHLEPIQYLLKLQSGDFRSNNIINIRPLIHFIKAGVPIVYSEDRDYYEINLYDNPLTHPPVEIVKQGNKAILDWFDEYEKSQAQGIQFQPLNEVRVIILGWGKVGKTTLRKRLLGEAVSETETQTDGIDIDIWRPEGLPDVALRVWDFGGQEIQHTVHNLFLQDNCVYLLVIDKRKDQNKNEDLVYWLEHIRSFGGQSPILIVENSIDTDRSINPQSTPEDIADLVYLNSEIRQSFPDANIDYVGVSALKGYNIDTLKTKLFTLAAQQNNEGLYAPDWLAAKNEVEQSITQGTELGGLARQNYITKETFDLECIRHQIAEATDHNTLLNVMQQLGVVSYYKKSDDKANWLILNPEWLTTAIYSVSLHPNLKRLNGHFQRSDVLAILSSHIETEGFFSKKNYQYSETEMGYVLDLMLDFELCFSPNNQDFYFPMGFKDNYQSRFVIENPLSISFLFDYETLPKAIWYKILVRLFKLNLIVRYWGSGVELEYGETKGLIQINTLRHRRIQIWIDGAERTELLDIIRRALDTVHEDFRSIPVTPKVFTDKGDEIKYQDLLHLFVKNIPTYQVAFGNDYNVKELLKRIETLEETTKQIDLIQRKQLSKGNGNQYTYINYGNDMRGASITVIHQQARDISDDLAAIKRELAEENQAQIQSLIDVLAQMQQAPTPEKAKGALPQLRETMKNITKIASEEGVKWATKKVLDGLYDKIAEFGNSISPDFMDSINLSNFV
jgi:internalin A